MQYAEEYNLRRGLVHDPAVQAAFDSSFWKGDTANLAFDSVKNAYKIGDTSAGAVGAISSYSQYLFGDFEFTLRFDSLSPDSNDGASLAQGKRFGLFNPGDTLERGAAYFEMRYDTIAGGDTTNTRPFRAVVRSETGTVQRKNITWDTLWAGGGADTTNTRYRIKWESDGYTFLINDTVYATLGDRPDSATSTFQINTSIPQAIRISNSTVDATDTSAMSLKFLVIRNSRMINRRIML